MMWPQFITRFHLTYLPPKLSFHPKQGSLKRLIEACFDSFDTSGELWNKNLELIAGMNSSVLEMLKRPEDCIKIGLISKFNLHAYWTVSLWKILCWHLNSRSADPSFNVKIGFIEFLAYTDSLKNLYPTLSKPLETSGHFTYGNWPEVATALKID